MLANQILTIKKDQQFLSALMGFQQSENKKSSFHSPKQKLTKESIISHKHFHKRGKKTLVGTELEKSEHAQRIISRQVNLHFPKRVKVIGCDPEKWTADSLRTNKKNNYHHHKETKYFSFFFFPLSSR